VLPALVAPRTPIRPDCEAQKHDPHRIEEEAGLCDLERPHIPRTDPDHTRLATRRGRGARADDSAAAPTRRRARNEEGKGADEQQESQREYADREPSQSDSGPRPVGLLWTRSGRSEGADPSHRGGEPKNSRGGPE
jgi:hypothetical protein